MDRTGTEMGVKRGRKEKEGSLILLALLIFLEL